jgi:hypothetical protein
LIVSVPEAPGVKVTEQVPAVRLQLGALKAPLAVVVNLTVPLGVLEVPVAVSVTVAVHVEAWFAKTGVVQDIVVDVVRRLTGALAVPVLVMWDESPL